MVYGLFCGVSFVCFCDVVFMVVCVWVGCGGLMCFSAGAVCFVVFVLLSLIFT